MSFIKWMLTSYNVSPIMAQIFVWYVHWYVRRTWDSVWHIVGIWQTFVEWKNTCKHAWKTRNNCFCLFCLLLQDHLTSINNSTIIHVQECSTLFTYIYDLIWEKAMAPHSSTVARKIPWMEEPGRLQSMGSHRVGHDLAVAAWSDLILAIFVWDKETKA